MLPPDGWEPYPNVRVGVSVERQEYEQRIIELLESGAPHPWVSYEPALGPLDLCLGNTAMLRLEWVIVGGESGPGARPFEVAWARSVVEQCRDAGVACFVKQLGARPIGEVYRDGFYNATRIEFGAGASRGLVEYRLEDRKGGDPSEWPRAFRVREFPR